MSRRDLKVLSKGELIDEVLKLQVLLDQQMSAAPGIGTEVTVQGIVSMTSRKPVVQMRAGEAVWQMDPPEARQHALVVLDAAVEAERDAATIAMLTGSDIGSSIDEAGGFLQAMREHRANWLEELKR